LPLHIGSEGAIPRRQEANMKKFAIAAAIPLLAGFLMAQQSESTTTTTTTKTSNFNGSLIDQNCYTTHVQQKDSNSDGNGGSTETVTNKYTTECPVTSSTTSFGMVTADGKFVRFDDAGNTRIEEMVKSNKDWNDYIVNHKPVKVRVIGTANGDVVVIKQIH
jgi:hypothetical protein